MERRTVCGIIIAAVLGVFPAAVFFSVPAVEDEELCGFRKSFVTMGTVASFTLYAKNAGEFKRAADAGAAEFEKVVKIANLYNKNSELSRLNAEAYERDFVCSAELWSLLMRAEKAYYESGGLFDITIKPLMDIWGFYRKRNGIPSTAENASAMTRCGFDKLKFDRQKRTVRFTRSGMALDLGGIAKGFAVDNAAAAVVEMNIKSGVIDLGGNLKLLPNPPPGKKYYTVAVRDPAKRGAVLTDTLELPGDTAVASSGDYERFVSFDGKRYGHIIDPVSGQPVVRDAATAVAVSALDADIFSTSAYLGGKEFARKLKLRRPEIKIYFFKGADN